MRKYDVTHGIARILVIQVVTVYSYRYYFVVPSRLNVMNIASIDSVIGLWRTSFERLTRKFHTRSEKCAYVRRHRLTTVALSFDRWVRTVAAIHYIREFCLRSALLHGAAPFLCRPSNTVLIKLTTFPYLFIMTLLTQIVWLDNIINSRWVMLYITANLAVMKILRR